MNFNIPSFAIGIGAGILIIIIGIVIMRIFMRIFNGGEMNTTPTLTKLKKVTKKRNADPIAFASARYNQRLSKGYTPEQIAELEDLDEQRALRFSSYPNRPRAPNPYTATPEDMAKSYELQHEYNKMLTRDNTTYYVTRRMILGKIKPEEADEEIERRMTVAGFN